MEFNYNGLKVLILDKFQNYKNFADAIGWNVTKLHRKLNNVTKMFPEDVYTIANALGIEPTEIGLYFFTLKV